jgi:cytochrome oxidase Cu insertion factor (SCO1/SenC/PrrC family)
MKPLSVTALLLLLTIAVPVSAQAPAGNEAERALVTRYLLMDTRGRAITDKDFPGRFQLISFGYTYCPDICPTTLAEVSLIMKRLGELSARLQPIFVTVDPERDTPATLSRYTSYFHPDIIGLTGSPDLVRRAADNFKVRYERHYQPGGDPELYSIDHSAGMYLLGPDGNFVTKFAYATPISKVTARIRDIMENTAPL